MSGVFLEVGHTCSGARTFLECEALAFVICLFDRRFCWQMFAFAAGVALVTNMIRCSILLAWIFQGWPYFQIVHDVGGMAIVGCAFFVIANFYVRRKKHA